HQRCKVHLVDDGDVAPAEHHRVLVYHIIPFRCTYDHNPFLCSEREIGGAYHVPHVLDEEEIDMVKVKVIQRVLDKVRIEVALFARIGIDRRDAEGNNPPEIIIPVHVACNGAGFYTSCLENGDKPLDECSLPGTDRTQEVKGTHPVGLEMAGIGLRDAPVDIVDIFLQP